MIKLMKNSFLFLLLMVVNSVYAQVVKGTVSDGETGDPLIGVNVFLKGTSSGTITDFEGQYNISAQAGDVLVFSYIGYLEQEIILSSQTVLDVILSPDAAQLEEVVVIGYGSQKKKDLTGSVATISMERLQEKPNNNFAQALQGAVPGINISANSSSAEQNDFSILVRGRNSINASNAPLIVLDGVPYNGSISDINPNDIASITVLKDASSTSIYGSRGANGVILINSKTGIGGGKPRISFSASTGINQIANIPEVYDGPGFAKFKEEREPGELTETELNNLAAGKSTDWLDLATQNGVRRDFSLSVSGSNDAVNYYTSAGFQNVKGVAVNDEFTRATLRINLGLKITDELKFGTSTQLSYIDRSGRSPTFGGDDNGAYFLNPLANAYDDNGELTIFPWPEQVFYSNALSNTLVQNDDYNNKIFSNNYLEYQPAFLPGLSLKINTGVELENRDIGDYYNRKTNPGFVNNGLARVFSRASRNYLIENILNYRKVFNRHTIDFTALYSAQKDRMESTEIEGVGFPNDLLNYRQMNLALGTSYNAGFIQTSLLSQMGRLNYSYADKYLLTLTLRRDGYSGFGENSRFGIFPSAAFSWRISEESFFEMESINNLKLRISYGKNGNQAVGPYDNLARLNDRSYLIGGQTAPGFVPVQLANNELSWESTITQNLGVDLSMWDYRFTASLDVYQAYTTDLLLDRLIPSVHGITEITQNIGETKNLGFDLSLSASPIRKKELSWQVGGNLSYNKNEIVSLFGKDQDDVGNELFIGQPIRVNYGYQFDGIWQENEDPSNSAQPNAVPGDIKVLDVANIADSDGNPIKTISANEDRVIQGKLDPTLVFGLENTLKYKNLSFYIFFQGVSGVTKRNSIYDENVYGGVQRNWFVLDYWTPSNPINTNHRNNEEANNYGVRIYESADFVRLKDITLSYTFDKLGGLNKSVKIYGTARNLMTFTGWTGLDPELSGQNSVPLQKEFLFGINLIL
jgi:TonB-linked SusC/RagA family outer membrane protein